MDAAGQGGQNWGADGVDKREDSDELSGHLHADRKIFGDLRKNRGDHETFCSDRECAECEAVERLVPVGRDRFRQHRRGRSIGMGSRESCTGFTGARCRSWCTASVPGPDTPKNLESAVAHDIRLLGIQASRHPCTERQCHFEPFGSIYAGSGKQVKGY